MSIGPTGPDLTARLAEVEAQIMGRAPEHDLVPTLDRVAAVMELLGDPQRSFRVIHLTGTNGKTSTTRMIEALCREHGLRTGRFTSPHLHSMRERIAVDGEPVSADVLVQTWDEVAPIIDLVDARSAADGGPRMTFFEVLVVLAYAAVSYTHLRAHETVLDLVCRLLLEKKKKPSHT